MTAQSSPVSGAINGVLASPTDANTLYVGAVNGGIWKTTNGGTTWTPLTDFQQSLSIGDLEFDPTDATSNTLIAGIGRFSSYGDTLGGARTGLLYTTNGGSSWTPIDGGLAGKNITEVAARGSTIVAAVNTADSFTDSNIGIFRSTDGGGSFTHISGSSGTDAPNGLPGGRAFDLAADPTNNSTLYVGIRDAGANNGIYKSNDTGATWTRVSNATMNDLNVDDADPYHYTAPNASNIEISVGNSGQVYVGIIGGYGQLTGLFRTGDGGGTWTQLDTPTTNENGHAVGLQPDEDDIDIAGGQGAIHFSIQADPTNVNVVYVGGDRQPSQVNVLGGETGVFPNSIGAQNHSGRLFSVDASKTAGTQATPLTHNFTSNGSAPHADSRAQTFDANGNLIEVDDGGIYKRTSPSTTAGAWTSLNGNLHIAEIHSIAYDRVAKTIFAGTQDTGSIEQAAAGSTTWRTSAQGDGAKVAVYVDPHLPNPTQSVRYTSYTYLQYFTRTTFDASNNVTSTTSPAMNISSGTGSGSKVTTYFGEHLQFYNPIAVNHRNGNLYVGSRYVFESSDGGDNFANIGYLGGYDASCFDAGGMYNGVENPDVLYVGANVSGPSYSSYTIFSRTSTGGALTQDTAYTHGPVQDLVMDTADWHNLFVADTDQIFESTNAALSFADITGNLTGQNFHTLAFAELSTISILLAGADNGVFYATSDDWTNWLELGATSLPNAPVYDLQYDSVDDILVAGTLGRSAWTITNFSATFVPEPGSLALLAVGSLGLLSRRRS